MSIKVFPTVYTIEVFDDDCGNVCLEQYDPVLGKNVVVAVPHEHIQAVIKALRKKGEPDA